jgi:signal transduction histidine kinase
VTPSTSSAPLPTRLAACAASLLLQAMSLALFLGSGVPSDSPVPWHEQFVAAVSTSGLLTLASTLARSGRARTWLLLARALTLSLLLVPFSETIGGIKLPLLLALYIDIGVGLRLAPALAVAAVATLLLWGPFRFVMRWTFEPAPELPVDTPQLLAYCALLVTAAAYGRLQSERSQRHRASIATLEESIKRLTDANTGFQRYLRVAEENSKTNERNRIIRELHDSIGYTLTTIIMLGESGLEKSRRDGLGPLAKLYEHIRDNAKTGLNDVRVALRLIKARKDEISDVNALDRLVDAFRTATNVEVNAHYGNIPSWFGPSLDCLVFRIIQEGMVNAFRHGHARRIDISLWAKSEHFLIRLRDDGTGGEEMTEGLGTRGMRERVEEVGGSLSLMRTPRGFVLDADLPLLEPAREEET